jgi:glyoxylase-like metal-dependent hydrolase (beta-lactamase superfamily II)
MPLISFFPVNRLSAICVMLLVLAPLPASASPLEEELQLRLEAAEANAQPGVHDDDLEAARSLDGLLDIYGFEGQARNDFATMIVEEFHYETRPDAQGFSAGHVFDLGGSVTVEAMHLPGHTRGHSGFVIDDVFFLSDIDLTGFGPYYGDAWSDLDQFDASLDIAREVEANWYVTFHHKGIIEGRPRFVEMIDEFQAVIGRRHQNMLAFLAEPRTLEDMATRRFVYRPNVEGMFIDAVERRTAELHLGRMIDRGEASEVDPGRFQRS